MGNHRPNNFPGHHCKIAKDCEFIATLSVSGLYTLGQGGPGTPAMLLPQPRGSCM